MNGQRILKDIIGRIGLHVVKGSKEINHKLFSTAMVIMLEGRHLLMSCRWLRHIIMPNMCLSLSFFHYYRLIKRLFFPIIRECIWKRL